MTDQERLEISSKLIQQIEAEITCLADLLKQLDFSELEAWLETGCVSNPINTLPIGLGYGCAVAINSTGVMCVINHNGMFIKTITVLTEVGKFLKAVES